MARNRRYPEETISDADDGDDPELLTNTAAQAKCLLIALNMQ